MKKGSDYTLELEMNEDCLELTTSEYDDAIVDQERDESGLSIGVNRDTGEPVLIVIERFFERYESAIKMLRDNPLPWTFSLPALGIKEKPLEDVLLAVWKKYKAAP